MPDPIVWTEPPPRGKPYETEDGRKICGAKNREGNRCCAVPMANGRCYFHGGVTAPPSWMKELWAHGGSLAMEHIVARLESDPDSVTTADLVKIAGQGAQFNLKTETESSGEIAIVIRYEDDPANPG